MNLKEEGRGRREKGGREERSWRKDERVKEIRGNSNRP